MQIKVNLLSRNNYDLFLFSVYSSFCYDLKLFAKQHYFIVGWNDVKLIAKRYKQVFPHIFGDKYDEGKFLFRYTDVQRTEASYRAFVEGNTVLSNS